MFHHDYINMNRENMQEVLIDKQHGKKIDWRFHKLNTFDLSNSYCRLGESEKAYKIDSCGTHLEFRLFSDGVKKLNRIDSCKLRLCPMCAWRRSLKIFGQVSKVMNKVIDDFEYRFIFVTLTVRNVYGEQLDSTVDNLLSAFNLMTKRKEFKKVSKGWFRCLEITHDTEYYITSDMWHGNLEKHIKGRADYYKRIGLNIGDENPSYNTFHPHIHFVLAVDKSYFTNSRLYLSQADWSELWKSCLSVDYMPIVHVEAFTGKKNNDIAKGVAEASKYAVKPSDIIAKDDFGVVNEYLTDTTVHLLDAVLHRRRLVAFGGVLKAVHKQLNLDDTIDGDLVQTDNSDELRNDLNYVIVRYQWNVGYKNYFKDNRN